MLRRVRRAGKEALLMARPGWFWAYVKWRHGLLEPEMDLVPLLCQKHKVSVDVGASDGAYTYLLEQHSRAVVSFEPRPRAAEMLRRAYRNKHVRVVEAALSDREGSTEMRVANSQYGNSTIESSNPLENKIADMSTVTRIDVATHRLDDIDLGGEVGFIKIDVEGHEESVLAGATRTLEAMPAMLVEVEERHHAGSVARVAALLTNLGYRRFYFRDGRLHDGATFDTARMQDPANQAAYIRNFIFLPEHRIGDFARVM
jgi:FkbM family methyltransferase